MRGGRAAQSQQYCAGHPDWPSFLEPVIPAQCSSKTPRTERRKSELRLPLTHFTVTLSRQPWHCTHLTCLLRDPSHQLSAVSSLSLSPLATHIFLLPPSRQMFRFFFFFAAKLLQRQSRTHTHPAPSTSLLSHLSFFSKLVLTLNFAIWKGSRMTPNHIPLTKIIWPWKIWAEGPECPMQ